MNERWKPSVTVAAVIAREYQGRQEYLLVEEQADDGLKLNNPAGHLEPGESPLQGVVREALEESGRVFTADHFLGVYLASSVQQGRPITYVRLAFSGTVGEVDPNRVLDHGIVRTLWMSLDEVRASAARHRSPLVQRCIEDHAAGQAWPLSAIYTDATVWGPGVDA